MRRSVVVLGSTGSIGTQALEIIQAFPDLFELTGMSCFSNIDLFARQVSQFKPNYVSVSSEAQKVQLLNMISYQPTVFVGEKGLIDLVQVDLDILLVAIVGTAALPPVVEAISRVSHIAIANKEVLVAAGEIIMGLVKKYQTTLIPVDSEHSALFQCLAAVDFDYDMIKRLTLTASGGPFWDRDPATFSNIQPKDALKHPNWDMGAKISIDSATMANKGLEVIEAHYLFDMAYDDIDVVIHPKSIVHSFVETIDGAIFAHMGRPDMRYPIQYAMTYPKRLQTPWPQASLTELSGLEFYAPKDDVFPLLKLAYECGRQGGCAPLVFNAANECVVERFLKGNVDFVDISRLIQDMLDQFSNETVHSIEDVILLDQRVKQAAFV